MVADREALLRDEYLQLQKTVEDFDGRSLTIKAWSVTLSTTGVGLAYQQQNKWLLLAAAIAALAFWMIDWVWKLHQQAFYPRIEAIEAWFRADPAAAAAPTPPFQIARSWNDSTDDADRWWRRRAIAVWYPGVFLPHLVVAAVAGGLLISWDHTRPPKDPPPKLEMKLR
ncbi:MAG TPA: hypothetical protein VFQ67_08215 [Allosphingosinicella sp.]|jgi:hypothetical protein|nr:hypothetical protein [Allosphingosinicella sp.]